MKYICTSRATNLFGITQKVLTTLVLWVVRAKSHNAYDQLILSRFPSLQKNQFFLKIKIFTIHVLTNK